MGRLSRKTSWNKERRKRFWIKRVPHRGVSHTPDWSASRVDMVPNPDTLNLESVGFGTISMLPVPPEVSAVPTVGIGTYFVGIDAVKMTHHTTQVLGIRNSIV